MVTIMCISSTLEMKGSSATRLPSLIIILIAAQEPARLEDVS